MFLNKEKLILHIFLTQKQSRKCEVMGIDPRQTVTETRRHVLTYQSISGESPRLVRLIHTDSIKSTFPFPAFLCINFLGAALSSSFDGSVCRFVCSFSRIMQKLLDSITRFKGLWRGWDYAARLKGLILCLSLLVYLKASSSGAERCHCVSLGVSRNTARNPTNSEKTISQLKCLDGSSSRPVQV